MPKVLLPDLFYLFLLFYYFVIVRCFLTSIGTDVVVLSIM